MKLSALSFLVTLSAVGGFAACGGSVNSGNPNPQNDAGVTGDDSGNPGDDAGTVPDAADEPPPPPLDHGKPSTTYPAFMPDLAQLQSNGGSTLTAPVIVSITWETDPNVTQLEAFSDQIGATAYWKAIGTEYGVGPATPGAHVHMPVNTTTPLPTSLSQSQLDQLVATSAGAPATSGWPAPTSQTIYILYLHPSTSLSFGGQSACSVGIGGYHTSTSVGGADIAYAIVPRCSFGMNALDQTTGSASHELGEAATDPHPMSLPAYYGFDQNHIAWEFFQQFQSENGDACEFYRDSFYKETPPFAFEVQRLWSNVSASAGHNPCVPVMTGPYFNVTPTALESVRVDLSAIGGSPVSLSKGIKIPAGMTKTFPVGFYSDAATGGPWSVRAVEGNPLTGGTRTSHLTTSIDRTTGQNGEIAYVTVTVNTAGSTIGRNTFAKANFITVISSLGGASHYMPILIAN